MQTLGKNSLMVYWVHVMMVYGDIFKPLKARTEHSVDGARHADRDRADGGAVRGVAVVEGRARRTMARCDHGRGEPGGSGAARSKGGASCRSPRGWKAPSPPLPGSDSGLRRPPA